MRFRASIFGYSALLLMLGSGRFVSTLWAQGLQRSTRSSSSSETNSLEIFKNLNRLDTKDDGGKKLEDELSKSLQPFANAHSLETVVPSTYQVPRMPVLKSRRSKEDIEESKGWFWNAEEVMSDGESSDSLGQSSLFPGLSSGSGADKRAGGWDRLSRKGSAEVGGKSFYGSSDQPSARRESRSDDDEAALPGGIREVAKSLKGRLESESVGSIFNPSTTRSSALDFFGQPLDSGPTPAQIEAQKSYLREYQAIIGGGQILSSPSGLGFVKPVTTPLTPASGGLDTLPGSTRRDLLSSSPASAPSVLLPATLPDVNASVLNQWNPMYTPVAPVSPKPAPFFSPPVEIPRRRF